MDNNLAELNLPFADADYVALAHFRRSLRLFLSFSEDAARTSGLISLTRKPHRERILGTSPPTSGLPPRIRHERATILNTRLKMSQFGEIKTPS